MEEVRSIIDDQVGRMDEIVGYQLERAMSDSSSLIKRAILVAPVIDKLQHAMQKVYPNTAIAIEVSEDVAFFGDERDFMELMGNLIDNACKYGRASVALRARAIDESILELTVEDDGPGIPSTRREQVLERYENGFPCAGPRYWPCCCHRDCRPLRRAN